jgi:hypothetical protein
MLDHRREKLALIHLAKKECALDETAYRALLYGAAGVESSALVESEEQFDTIMLAFKRLGFKSSASEARKRSPYCSRGQLAYIRKLWDSGSREKTDSALRSMVRRIGHVDDMKFLTKRSAQALIIALRAMCWKAGKNPDEIKAQKAETEIAT